MARKPRLCVSDVIHYVTANVIDSRVLFRDSNDKEIFIELLNKYLTDTGFDLLGIAFYPQHYEMVLRLNDRPMKDLFQRFHSAYARYYNKKHGFEGYLFQGRPKSIPVEDGPYAQLLIAYLHTGPIRARLCKTIEELDKFKDCTHSAVMGNSHFPNLRIDQILKLYSSDEAVDPKNLYRKVLKQMMEKCGSFEDFLDMLKACKEEKQSMYESGYWIIGSPKFIKDALKQDKDKRVRMANYVRINWDHDRLADFVFSRMPISIDDIKRRGRNNAISDARKLYCYFAVTILEMKTISTAERLNVTSTAVCRLAKLGEKIAKSKGMEFPVH
jgi:hypothetical protein